MCHYDALMNTVEEQFFLPSDRPYAAVKEELGKLAVENSNGQAWIYSRGMILQIDLETSQVTVLANDIPEELVQISDSGQTAAWTDGSNGVISLLHTEKPFVPLGLWRKILSTELRVWMISGCRKMEVRFFPCTGLLFVQPMDRQCGNLIIRPKENM